MKSINKRLGYLVNVYFGEDLLSMIEDLLWERDWLEDPMSTSKSRQGWGHDDRSLESSKSLVSEVCVGYFEPGRIHVQDEWGHGTHNGWGLEYLWLSWWLALGWWSKFHICILWDQIYHRNFGMVALFILMDTLIFCEVNAWGILGMAILMWYVLVDRVINTLMI
jgi:hypothetical protein